MDANIFTAITLVNPKEAGMNTGRRWHRCLALFPIWCAVAVSPVPATAQVGARKVPLCKASQLSAAEDRNESEEMDGGAGNQAMTIAIRNRSLSPCALQGIPGLTLLDSANRPFSTHVCPNCSSYLFPIQPVKTILLEPNRSAYLIVGYRTECRKAAVLGFHPSDRRNALNIAVAGMIGPRRADGPPGCRTVDVTPFLEKPPVQGSLPPEH